MSLKKAASSQGAHCDVWKFWSFDSDCRATIAIIIYLIPVFMLRHIKSGALSALNCSTL